MNSTKALRPIAAFAVAVILAGCASALQSSSNALPVMVQQAETPMTCKSDHGVSVKPCSINLSLSNPQESVTTKGPTGTFRFNDATCKNKHIATIAGSGHTFRQRGEPRPALAPPSLPIRPKPAKPSAPQAFISTTGPSLGPRRSAPADRSIS